MAINKPLTINTFCTKCCNIIHWVQWMHQKFSKKGPLSEKNEENSKPITAKLNQPQLKLTRCKKWLNAHKSKQSKPNHFSTSVIKLVAQNDFLGPTLHAKFYFAFENYSSRCWQFIDSQDKKGNLICIIYTWRI